MSTPTSPYDSMIYEDGYEVVSFRISWSNLSIVLFVFTLLSPYLSRFLALPWIGYFPPRLVWVPVVFGVSILGILCGWLGHRFSTSKSLAKMGMVLNGIVLSLMLLFALAMTLILGFR